MNRIFVSLCCFSGIVLPPASRSRTPEIDNEIAIRIALMEWLGELQQRFAGKGKVLVALEQSRGALIYHLMGYEFLELYPINPAQLASYRETFSPSGAKDDRPDAELICELLYCHGDRLKAWKPDSELTRKLAFLNEGRRKAVDQRTQLANEIKSQLKVYFPLALQVLDNNSSTALAADLLLQWPTLGEPPKTECAQVAQVLLRP
jgi:transposase